MSKIILVLVLFGGIYSFATAPDSSIEVKEVNTECGTGGHCDTQLPCGNYNVCFYQGVDKKRADGEARTVFGTDTDDTATGTVNEGQKPKGK